MKRTFYLFFALLAVAACSTKEPKVSIFSGQIINPADNIAFLISEGVTDTISLNEDGTFSKEITLSHPSYFTLKNGRGSTIIFALPGEDLKATINLKDPSETPVFEGKTADINQYIHKVSAIARSIAPKYRELYSAPRDIFVLKLDSIKNEYSTLLKNSDIHNKSFLELENARIGYMIRNLLHDYPVYKSYFAPEDSVNYEDDYKFSENIDYNKPEHLHIAAYADLIMKNFQLLFQSISSAEQNVGKSEFEKMVIYFEKVDSLVSDSKIRDFIKHNSVIEAIQWSSLEVSKNVVEHFLRSASTESYRNIVANAFARRMLLAPGANAPEFTLTGIDGAEYSLKDFRGKLVYIDFWATWCRPCLMEIPHLTKLKEAYKNKPIAFVAISVDSDKSAWEEMVKRDKLSGYQLYAENNWQSETAKNYQVRGIPTFVLIDGEGKIIEYNAPRPSNSEINLLIDKYLKTLP